MEILLGALAEAIIGLLIEELAQRPGLSGLREKLRGDSPEKIALQRALAGAYAAFGRQHPHIADAFFDEYLLQQEAVKTELAKLLRPNQQPDSEVLKQAWQSQFAKTSTVDLDKPIKFFIGQLDSEIKAQPALKPFVDSRALDQLYEIAKRTGQQVAEQQITNTLLTEIRELLKGAQTPFPIATYSVTAIFAQHPGEIPDQPDNLIGRETLQAEVESLLNSRKHVLLLQGFGGMGKTALAATIAAKWVSEKGPVLWLKAGQASADALFEGLARPFNAQQAIASAQGEAKIAVLQQILVQSGTTLLVIDDAWEGDVLAPILKSVPPHLPVLLTSRIRHGVDEIKTVGELEPAAALELLEQHAGAKYQNNQDAAKLCDLLGYHAFAIEIAGKTLKVDMLSPGELLRQIENAPHQLAVPNELALDNRRHVADLIEVSLNALKAKGDEGEAAYNVFLAFGAFFAPSATPELLTMYFRGTPEVSDDQLADIRSKVPGIEEISDNDLRVFLQQQLLNNLDPAPAEAALKTLARRGLAERIPESDNSIAYYHIHDLAHSYAHAQTSDNDRHRAVDACLNYIGKYKQPSLQNFAHLRPEIDNFMGAAERAFGKGRFGNLVRFVELLYEGPEASGGFLFYQGYYQLSVLLLEQAAQAAARQGNRSGEGNHLGNLGIAYASLGQYQQAIDHFQQALAISREIGDRRGEGNHLGNLGIAYASLGQYQQAIDHFQQALAISREIGDRRGEGQDLGNLGNAYADLGQYQQAIDHHQQALAISREIGDRRAEGNRLGNLGIAYASLGQYQQAIDHYQQALAISREIGDRRGEGNHLGNLGNAYRNLGQYAQAIDYHQQALAISREIGDRHGEGQDLGNLGNAYRNLGQYEQAIDHFQQALAISREIGDRQGEGNRLGNLGNAYADLGQYEQAIDYYQQARTIFESIGVQHLVEKVDENIAIIQAAMAESSANNPAE